MTDQPVQYGPPFQRARTRKTRRKVQKAKHVNRGLSAKSLEALGAMRWYLIRVPSTREFVVEGILDRAGLVAFVPIEMRFRRQNRYQKKRTQMRFALMPGYMLIALPERLENDSLARRADDAAWSAVFRHRMVLGVVGSDGTATKVPFREVRHMLERHLAPEMRKAKGAEWMRTYAEFKPGDQVEVLTGSLSGLVVEVTEINGPMAKMVIELFGGKQAVELPVNDLGRVA